MPYHILLAPLISLLIVQVIKPFIKTNQRKLSLKSLMVYSGMPSGHSALIISLVTIIGLEEGVKSPLFAVSAILAIIVIRDALGARRYLEQHGHILNILVKDLEDDNVLEAKYPRLLEKIGHTPLQVFIGSIIGLFVSVVIYFFS